MSRIRGRDTRPEIVVRSILHRLGYRFTINGPFNRALPGKPDIVLPKWKTVVLVHGCFWHAHARCKDFRMPKSRTEWWEEKLARNKARDARVKRQLKQAGWRVVTVWACEMKTIPKLESLVERLAREFTEPQPQSAAKSKTTVTYALPEGRAARVADEVKGYRVSRGAL